MSDLIFLTHRMPLPTGRDEDVRPWKVITHLAANHRIHLGCFYERAKDAHAAAALAEICASLTCVRRRRSASRLKSVAAFASGKPSDAGYRGSAQLARWVAETMAAFHPNLAFVAGTELAAYLEPYRFARRVIDMVELGSEAWRRSAETASWPWSEMCWRQERIMLAHEQRIAAHFDDTIFGSAAEAHLFSRRAPRAPAHVLAMRNGIDHGYFAPGDYANPFPSGRKSVVFAGAMDYPPNVEGAVWFATEVMTMLRHRFPTLDFWMVGAHPAHALRSVARGDIHLAGKVDDVRPYLAHADAVVVPLRVARGIENTVLQGMAMAKPVVATPAALEGLDFVPGQEVLCSASAPGFASGVAAALGERGAEIGARARRRVEADCGWSASLGVLDRIFGRDRLALVGAS
jgi:sugar transferase (PEP-CTERM/EpsH1 system associated)